MDIIRCDGCGRDYESDYELFTLKTSARTFGSRSEWHFCAKPCISQWIAKESMCMGAVGAEAIR